MTDSRLVSLTREFLALEGISAYGVLWTEPLADLLSEVESALMMVDLGSVDECSQQLPALLTVVSLFASMPEASECVRISTDCLDRLICSDDLHSETFTTLPTDVVRFLLSYHLCVMEHIHDQSELSLVVETIDVIERELARRSRDSS